jgi:hypothetical protein
MTIKPGFQQPVLFERVWGSLDFAALSLGPSLISSFEGS